MAINLAQQHFRFRNDANNPDGGTRTWLEAEDTNITIAVEAGFAVRFVIANPSGDNPPNAPYTLRAQKNGTGGYTQVTTTRTDGIQAYQLYPGDDENEIADDNFGDGVSAGSGSPEDQGVYAGGVNQTRDHRCRGDRYAEVDIGIILDSDNTSPNDYWDLRLYHNGAAFLTYTVTARVTAASGVVEVATDLDALLTRQGETEAASLDALLTKQNNTLAASLHAYLTQPDLTEATSLDAVLIAGGVLPVNLDAALAKLNILRTLSLHGFITEADILRTASLDGLIAKTFDRTVGLDGLLLKQGITRTASLDGLIATLVTSGVSLDSLLFRGGVTATTALDAIIYRIIDATVDLVGYYEETTDLVGSHVATTDLVGYEP